LSNKGSINSWLNQHIPSSSSNNVGQKYDEGRFSMGEVPNETSYYDQDEKLAVSDLIETNYCYQLQYEGRANANVNNAAMVANRNTQSEEILQQDLAGLGVDEEKKLEMMISGGDYSPNSHTFFKHPFKGS
jgi:hypothetical protein